jgi:hypothetical protein
VTDVLFSHTEPIAYVVCRNVIKIIDFRTLSETPILPTIEFGGIVSEQIFDREALCTRDGKFIFIRSLISNEITVIEVDIDMMQGQQHIMELPALATDLDLTPDSKIAIVVMRDDNKISIIDIPNDILNPGGIDTIDTSGMAVGQAVISPIKIEGQDWFALLYTNVEYVEGFSKLNITEHRITPYNLEKAVNSIAISPDAETALVFHISGINPQETSEYNRRIDQLYGYTIFNLPNRVWFLQTTEVEQGDFAFSPTGDYAVVLVHESSRNINEVHLLYLRGVFLKERINLQSPPTHVGFLPVSSSGSQRCYISQDHPAGRITFIDAESVEVRTITGFELAAQID